MSTKQWTASGVIVAIVTLLVMLLIPFFQKIQPTTQETNTASNSGVNTGVIAGKVEVNTFAVFTIQSKEIDIQPDGSYKATIKIRADKEDNLPSNFCLSVTTDAQLIGMGFTFHNGNENSAQSSSNGNSNRVKSCLSMPEANIVAEILLDRKPTLFDLEIN